MPAPYDLFDYPDYWKNRSYEEEAERIALEYFFRKIPDKGSLADLGGGYGRLSKVYSPLFGKCVVFDPSERNLETGRKMFVSSTNVSFKKATLPAIKEPDNSFDTAIMVRVSHHLTETLPSFKEVHRILKPGGYFILETANKIHFLAKLKAILTLNFSLLSKDFPLEKRSQKSIDERKITFVNHHPEKIVSELKSLDFEIIESLSVSNLRSRILKKIIPLKLLLSLEKFLQKPLAEKYFGPSIFFLAKKK